VAVTDPFEAMGKNVLDQTQGISAYYKVTPVMVVMTTYQPYNGD